jgi:hypothetical protein
VASEVSGPTGPESWAEVTNVKAARVVMRVVKEKNIMRPALAKESV